MSESGNWKLFIDNFIFIKQKEDKRKGKEIFKLSLPSRIFTYFCANNYSGKSYSV